MARYTRILLAVDLSDESVQLSDRAVEIARQNQAQLSLIHVVEPLSFAYGGDVPMDLSPIQEQLDEHARAKLSTYAQQLDYPVDKKFVVTGNTETEIHRIASNEETDLIIVGSHGRHGLALLLGSTANGVLHGAPCDVLAVRVHKEKKEEEE